jgi:DNA recombination-mediator protein A
LALGTTIGVLGCGIDVVYPKENKKVFEEIERRGAIISEFPMGTFPAPKNFPMRNRIVAGMALRVVVVEGGAVSRVANYGTAGDGIWARGVWGAGQRDASGEFRSERQRIQRGTGGADRGELRAFGEAFIRALERR